MNLLKREIAPILPEAWKAIDAEAARVLRLNLAARKLVDFSGPHGWTFAAVNAGRLSPLKAGPVAEVSAGLRTVQPLVEIRVPITLDVAELDAMARGAKNPDLSPVVRAAESIARAEDSAIFHGYAAGQITGIIDESPHKAPIVAGAIDWPRAVVQAKEALRTAGVDGPYVLALGSKAYDELSAASEDYPLRKRVEPLVEGGLVRASAVDGAVLVSTRGGDYELTVGQDLSIGYAYHAKATVELFLTESFTFRVLEPAAAVHIRRGAARR